MGSFDCVATCFFIDTAQNVLEYILQISRLLPLGGLWVNFGPLLYHYSDLNTYGNKKFTSLDLTYEELKGVFPSFGLTLIEEKLNCPCTYNRDIRSSSVVEFNCVLFTCRKTSDQIHLDLLRFPKTNYWLNFNNPLNLISNPASYNLHHCTFHFIYIVHKLHLHAYTRTCI